MTSINKAVSEERPGIKGVASETRSSDELASDFEA